MHLYEVYGIATRIAHARDLSEDAMKVWKKMWDANLMKDTPPKSQISKGGRSKRGRTQENANKLREMGGLCFGHFLGWGACLRGRTGTQRSKKGSEKAGNGSGEGFSERRSEKGVCCGFYSRKEF